MIGLIGATGFIGSNFTRLHPEVFPITRDFLSSSDVLELDELIIAAPSAKKYEINQAPLDDRTNIERLMFQISKNLIFTEVTLFSSVDVYRNTVDVDEESEILLDVSYGGNRGFFETHLREMYPNIRIRRLPGLFGPNLKKNLIFDLVNKREDQILKYSNKSTFQFIEVCKAISISMSAEYKNRFVLNVVPPPLKVSSFSDFNDANGSKVFEYNVRTKHAPSGYFLDSKQALEEIKDFMREQQDGQSL